MLTVSCKLVKKNSYNAVLPVSFSFFLIDFCKTSKYKKVVINTLTILKENVLENF